MADREARHFFPGSMGNRRSAEGCPLGVGPYVLVRDGEFGTQPQPMILVSRHPRRVRLRRALAVRVWNRCGSGMEEHATALLGRVPHRPRHVLHLER